MGGAIYYSIAIFFLNSPLLRLLGASGQLLTLGEEYIAVIAVGAALQVIGTGLVPLTGFPFLMAGNL